MVGSSKIVPMKVGSVLELDSSFPTAWCIVVLLDF